MEAVARVTGIDFSPAIKERRPGDPAIIVAEGRLAARDIDWQMRHTVRRHGPLGLGGPRSGALIALLSRIGFDLYKSSRI